MLSYLHSSGWVLSLLFYVCFNMLLSLFIQAFLWFYYTDYAAATAAKSLQSLCDPIDGSPPGSAIPGILQARTLEWVAISFSNAWKYTSGQKTTLSVCVCVATFPFIWFFSTPFGCLSYSIVGCRLWGRTESDTTEETQQQQQHLLKRVVFPPSLCYTLSCKAYK